MIWSFLSVPARFFIKNVTVTMITTWGGFTFLSLTLSSVL